MTPALPATLAHTWIDLAPQGPVHPTLRLGGSGSAGSSVVVPCPGAACPMGITGFGRTLSTCLFRALCLVSAMGLPGTTDLGKWMGMEMRKPMMPRQGVGGNGSPGRCSRP